MPGVVRENDLTAGHGCFVPEIPVTWSPNVYANNRKVIRNGDMRKVHPCPGDGAHPGVYIGQHKVFVNNTDIQIKGDPLSCGDFCDMCSLNVFVEGK
jgi:uncharacterized Zn-binding protein involved in type VI secretion